MSSVEEDMAAWRRELPAIDATAFGPILQAMHLAGSVATFKRRVLDPFEISVSEYDVLATLRRVGTPYRLNPRAIIERLDRSSGGMTKLLKRLEEGGYVGRAPDPEDGRGSLVVLSRRGLELQARIFAAFVSASENRLEGLAEARLSKIEDELQRLSEALDR